MHMTKGERRSQEIFATAARLFAQRGYSRTSIRDLAEELGMQKSSLYHYFDSKEDLLHRLLDDIMEQALPIIEELCSREMPPMDKLSAFMRFYTHVYAGDRDRLILLVNELDCLPPERREQVVTKQRRYVAAIRGILAELKQAGLLRDLPLSVLVFIFFAMVHYTPKWYDPAGPVSPDELGNILEQVYCQGILAPGVSVGD